MIPRWTRPTPSASVRTGRPEPPAMAGRSGCGLPPLGRQGPCLAGLGPILDGHRQADDARPYAARARLRPQARSPVHFRRRSAYNLEVDCEWLDYTWNWGTYLDCQAFTNAFPAPRRNVNINRSVAEARLAFMDNLFLNVWPSKPDGINGSERIANVPELSATLKTCAALSQAVPAVLHRGSAHRQLPDDRAAARARLSAYVRPDRVLAIVLNDGPEGTISFAYQTCAVGVGPRGVYPDRVRRARPPARCAAGRAGFGHRADCEASPAGNGGPGVRGSVVAGGSFPKMEH